MGELLFENQTLGSFLVYRLDPSEQIDQLAVGMLSHNQIPGFLPVNFIQVDAERSIRFPISSLTALMGYWGGTISRQKLLAVLSSFCRAILECREYLLNPSCILLAWDQVFVESLSGEVQLAYLPILDLAESQQTPETFIRTLLQRTTFAPDEDSGHIPVLLNAVNSSNFSVESLYEQLKELDRDKSRGSRRPNPVQPVQPVRPGQPIRPSQPVRPGQPIQPEPVRPGQPVRPGWRVQSGQMSQDDGGTVLLSGGGSAHTVSLEEPGDLASPAAKDSGRLCLVRRLTGEKAVIDQPVFHVGRERRIVDFCLTGGHDWVGTDHAYFLRKADGVYLVDNNSLNHTWLNGQQLVSNQPYPVKPGDIIKMADEEFDVLPG